MGVLTFLLLPVVLVIGLSCVAATVLGWVAVSQIRRSIGRLRGLGLAVFDGLVFPLLALDVLIGVLIYGVLSWLLSPGSPDTLVIVFLTLLASALLDWLIVRLVWRAVNKPIGIEPDSSPRLSNGPNTDENGPKAGGYRWLGPGMLALGSLIALGAISNFNFMLGVAKSSMLLAGVVLMAAGVLALLIQRGPARSAAGSNEANALQPVIVALVVHAGVLVLLGVLFVKVVPRFAAMFADFEVALPASTQIAIGFAGFLQQWGLLLLPLMLGVDAAICWLAHRVAQRKGLVAWSVCFLAGVGVAAGLCAMPIAMTARGLSVAAGGGPKPELERLAQEPPKLRKLSTDRLIEVAIAAPVEAPWPWNELNRRPLTSGEASRIMTGLTEWLQREYPEGYGQPLQWLGNGLEELNRRDLVPETNALAFLQAYYGKPAIDPLPRLREGESQLEFKCSLRSPWGDRLLGMTLLNEVRSVTLDGEPVEARDVFGRDWNRQDYRGEIALPALKEGRHVVRCEVESALVAEADMTGLATDAAAADWPPSKLRWTRTSEAEFNVYPKDAELVALSDDPALDPMAGGVFSISQVIIRSRGNGLMAVLPLDVSRKTNQPVSVDVSLRLAGNSYECGGVWADANAQSTSYKPGMEELGTGIDALAPQIRKADLVLTPNPEAVESRPGISRIWGEEIVFRQVPLRRLDLGEAEQAIVRTHGSGSPDKDSAAPPRPVLRTHYASWLVLLGIAAGFLVLVIVVVLPLVLVLRRNKSGGAGKAVAVGCGVVGLVGLVVLALVIGGVIWLRTRAVDRAESVGQPRASLPLTTDNQKIEPFNVAKAEAAFQTTALSYELLDQALRETNTVFALRRCDDFVAELSVLADRLRGTEVEVPAFMLDEMLPIAAALRAGNMAQAKVLWDEATSRDGNFDSRVEQFLEKQRALTDASQN